jgi:hypothetical protein
MTGFAFRYGQSGVSTNGGSRSLRSGPDNVQAHTMMVLKGVCEFKSSSDA